uniref:3-hydroxyacyl-CoA dehydrogenase type-2 n=1 Tax=Trieres chinensis TaxID=1514140 RepID=A0A7S1ZZQ1_TRICV|mmetsp:Transcript_36502/g.74485  ORF Transcript_36502/g.74485 Transcript_36502/m.74485 type:complete len:293 (+) Transcript_36502:228-1106(+)
MLRHVVSIVSGGASGLGAATSAAIVRHGGRVVVADLPTKRNDFLRLASASCADAAVGEGITNETSCDKTSSRDSWERSATVAEGPVIAFAEADVTDENQLSAALDLAEEKFGESVNVAVSCAGIALARKTLSLKKAQRVHSLMDFSNTLQINTVGTFNLARLSAERMAGRDPDAEGMRGCIINTASIAAFEGQTGQVAYAASKGAIVGMTLPLARDLAPHGIRVMTVAPGLFKTPLLENLPESVQADLGAMVPCPSRLGDPREFGKLVVSILTNPMLNGEVIRLDGALRMPP